MAHLQQFPSELWGADRFDRLSGIQKLIVIHALTCPESVGDAEYELFIGKISYRIGVDNSLIRGAIKPLINDYPGCFALDASEIDVTTDPERLKELLLRKL